MINLLTFFFIEKMSIDELTVEEISDFEIPITGHKKDLPLVVKIINRIEDLLETIEKDGEEEALLNMAWYRYQKVLGDLVGRIS